MNHPHIASKTAAISRTQHTRSPRWLWSGLLLWGLLPGVGCDPQEPMYLTDPDMSMSGGDMAGSGDGGMGMEKFLPCEVENVLKTRCQSCHNNPPVGAPMPLVSYAQLVAKSTQFPMQSYAERSLARMQDGTRPMPPGPTPTVPAAEITAFGKWVTGGQVGAPMKCGTMPPDDPFSKPPMCSSGKTYMGGTPKPEMNPGLACLTCHTRMGKAAQVQLAGTVYITGHEPDKCLGGPAPGSPAAVVEITDATKKVHMLTVNAAGNFLLRQAAQIPLPYTAKVIWNGKERSMVAAQMNTDCNSCHDQGGKNGAPGRIALP